MKSNNVQNDILHHCDTAEKHSVDTGLITPHDVVMSIGSTQSYNTNTHPFHGPLSRTTRVSRYQKGTTNLDFTEARDSEWQWHQLGHMQVCTSLQTDNHASTPPLKFFYRPDALPAAQPTASKHWRQLLTTLKMTLSGTHCVAWRHRLIFSISMIFVCVLYTAKFQCAHCVY